jgi:hypothetical protein
MKKKMKRFQSGGVADENFTADQIKWLGGADRTDPYILARMRSAHPDAPKPTSRDFDAIDPEMVAPSRNLEAPVTKTVTNSKVSVTKPKSTWEDDSKIPPMPDMPKKSVKTSNLKSRDFDTTEPYINIPARSSIGLRQFKTNYKSGGSVSSASKRADGCAIKGKTRGKIC